MSLSLTLFDALHRPNQPPESTSRWIKVGGNVTLWSLYAGGGKGFTLEIDAQHEFFVAKREDGRRRNRLIKMHYRDDRVTDLFTNPYYLFGIKNSDFEFEREWRCLRKTDDCDEIQLSSHDVIYTVPAPRGLIKRVALGHRWNADDLSAVTMALKEFDETISLAAAIPNPTTGGFDFVSA